MERGCRKPGWIGGTSKTVGLLAPGAGIGFVRQRRFRGSVLCLLGRKVIRLLALGARNGFVR
jgi:hypothetical protein